MAAASVVGLASRCSKKKIQNIDFNATYAKLIILMNSKARALATHIHSANKPAEPHIASYVWGKTRVVCSAEGS